MSVVLCWFAAGSLAAGSLAAGNFVSGKFACGNFAAWKFCRVGISTQEDLAEQSFTTYNTYFYFNN